MLELKILNMKSFLKTVDACGGAVLIRRADGRREDIREYAVQDGLMDEYRRQKNQLTLSLEFPKPRDYMRLVSYYVEDR